MSRGQGIAAGIASNWFGLGLTIVVSFFLSPFVVNKLGSIAYGIWALALQFTSYLNLLDFGVRDAVVRYTSKYAARKQAKQLNRVLLTAIITYFPVILVCLAITAFCVWAVPGPFKIEPEYHDEARWAVLFTGLTLAQTFFFNVFLGIIHGLRRYDIGNWIGVPVTLVRVALVVFFLRMGHGLVTLAAVQFSMALCTGICYAVVALILLRKRGLSFAMIFPTRRQFRALSRRVLGFGAFSLLHSLAQKVVFGTDTIVIGIMMTVQAVTFYSIAASLAQYLKTLLSTSSRVFLPVASELHARGRMDELRRLCVSGAKLNVLIAVPIGVVLAVLGRDFIALWMGPNFAGTTELVLPILAVTQILSAPHNVIVNMLYGLSRHQTLAWLRVAEAAVNLSLSIFLARKLGLNGVALGTAIPHFVLVVFVLPRLVFATMGLGAREYLLGVYGPPLLASVPLVLSAFWVHAHLQMSSLAEFGIVTLGLLAIYAPCVYFIALAPEEKSVVMQKLGFRVAVGRTR